MTSTVARRPTRIAPSIRPDDFAISSSCRRTNTAGDEEYDPFSPDIPLLVLPPPTQDEQEHEHAVRARNAAQASRPKKRPFEEWMRSNASSVLMLSGETDELPFPDYSEELCAHDHHPINGRPYGLPVRYNTSLNKYEVIGLYCGVACMRRHNKSRRDANAHKRDVWIRAMARDVYGLEVTDADIAPPLSYLNVIYCEKKKEGNMSSGDAMAAALKEYRCCHQKVHIRLTELPFIRVCEVAEYQKRRDIATEEHNKHNELVKQQPRPLALTRQGQIEQKEYVIRRSEPQNKRRGIASMLGVNT